MKVPEGCMMDVWGCPVATTPMHFVHWDCKLLQGSDSPYFVVNYSLSKNSKQEVGHVGGGEASPWVESINPCVGWLMTVYGVVIYRHLVAILGNTHIRYQFS